MNLKISALTAIMFLFGASFSQAQQLNVIQVKGNRAIVEIQTGEKLKVGESYAVGKVDGEVSLDPVASGKGTRNYLIGLDFGFSNTKTDTANAKTQLGMSTTLKFGWNKKQYEYGPQFTMAYGKDGDSAATYTWRAGAFGTYNFQPNIIGTDLVLSGDATFNYGQQKASGIDTFGVMDFTAGPFVKWYGISDDHCIRGGLVFSWDKTDRPNASVTTTGILAIIGISTYF